MTTTTGQCLCGAVHFRVEGEALAPRVCWCRDCQYLGAGTGMANAGFSAEGFSYTGDVTWFESRADSGNLMQRGFCPRCGTPLFSRTPARAHLVFIRIGACDSPAKIAPQMTIWSASAPPWAAIDTALPQLPGQPAAPGKGGPS
ncbi:MAG: GFA family protein [Proteobacteria bacterium]|nr:GFA family protein [Pseudomonadota bacterium]